LIVLAGGFTALAPEGPPSSAGWRITVYYTAVESYHDGDRVDVRGCPVITRTAGSDPLGDYPHSFVDAVREEGTGRITSGEHAGRFLNWSAGEGYWLDDAPRDAAGRPLERLRSAAADGVAQDTAVRTLDCGRGWDGGAPDPEVCALLTGGGWEIRDEFGPGVGGPFHIDLDIGEEDRPSFTTSPVYTTFEGATLRFTPPTG
jgi:hypothetical protein